MTLATDHEMLKVLATWHRARVLYDASAADLAAMAERHERTVDALQLAERALADAIEARGVVPRRPTPASTPASSSRASTAPVAGPATSRQAASTTAPAPPPAATAGLTMSDADVEQLVDAEMRKAHGIPPNGGG